MLLVTNTNFDSNSHANTNFDSNLTIDCLTHSTTAYSIVLEMPLNWIPAMGAWLPLNWISAMGAWFDKLYSGTGACMMFLPGLFGLSPFF